MVGVVAEHKEAATACDDARLIGSDALQNLLFRLKDVICNEEIRDGRLVGNELGSGKAGHNLQTALEVSPPVMLLALQPFNFRSRQVILLFQLLNERLVVERHTQTVC